MKQVNRISVSNKEKSQFDQIKNKHPHVTKKIIYSFYPVDRHDCPCQKTIQEFNYGLDKLSFEEVGAVRLKTEYIRCPRDKTGMTKFKLYCTYCGELVGECYATDNTLKDFCDFHYVSTHNGEYWQGVLGVNMSPIDGMIGIECCCGNDTRDFRANNTLDPNAKKQKMLETSIGREYGKKTSGYKVVPD